MIPLRFVNQMRFFKNRFAFFVVRRYNVGWKPENTGGKGVIG
jgi:hypothetical protein